MTKEEYQEQLLDDRWSKKRHKILARDKGKCIVCKSKERLEVHHLYYIKGHKAWEYPNNALVVWCNDCHRDWHENHNLIVLEHAFSKGRKRLFKPPVKPKKFKKTKKRFNNRRVGIREIHIMEFQKMVIPIEDRKGLQKIIRHMNTGKRIEFLNMLRIKYKI